MSDQLAGTRVRDDGTKDDRRMSYAQVTAGGAAAGLSIGGTHWLVIDCFAGGAWSYVPPDPHLLSIASTIIVAPVALWFARIFSLIGDIITNRLQKDAAT